MTGGIYDLNGENWGNSGQTGAAVGRRCTDRGDDLHDYQLRPTTAVTLAPSNTTLNANLIVNNSGDITWSGGICGAAGLTKTAAALLSLEGAVTVGGGLTVNGFKVNLEGPADNTGLSASVGSSAIREAQQGQLEFRPRC